MVDPSAPISTRVCRVLVRMVLGLALLAGVGSALAWSVPPGVDSTSTAGPTGPAPAAPAAASTSAPASAPAVRAVPASRMARNITVITIHDPIDRVTASSVSRRMREAQAAGADLIVIELDTPGGEVGAVLDICSTIKQSPVRTVAWINTQAYSGGALVALACNEIIVSDPVSMGDAKPIELVLGGGVKPIEREILMKLLPPLIGAVVDSAQRHNRSVGRYQYDELLVQGIIVSDAELWQIENKETGQTMCITGAEFKMLFPGAPLDGTPMLAGASSVSRPSSLPQPGSLPKDAADAAPVAAPADPAGEISFTSASPTAQSAATEVKDTSNSLLSVPSLRPRLGPGDVGKWRLIGKVSAGTGPLIFGAEDMRHFGFASNADGSNSLIPIRNDLDLKAYYTAQSITRLDQSWAEDAVGFLTHPIVRGGLIIIFLVGLFVEASHPGLLFPGIIGGVALILIVAPPLLTGLAAWWAAVAILAGLACIALELFVIPGTMVAGLIGFVLLFGGLVGTFIPVPGSLSGNSTGHDLSLGLATVVLSMGTALIAMFFLGKYFGSIPLLRRAVLPNPDELEENFGESDRVGTVKLGVEDAVRVGAEAVAVSPLRPTGTIEVGGQIVEASAELGFISSGARVRIVSITGTRIVVEVLVDGPPPPAIADVPLPTPEGLN